MVNKRKRLARVLVRSAGMSYQGAVNVLAARARSLSEWRGAVDYVDNDAADEVAPGSRADYIEMLACYLWGKVCDEHNEHREQCLDSARSSEEPCELVRQVLFDPCSEELARRLVTALEQGVGQNLTALLDGIREASGEREPPLASEIASCIFSIICEQELDEGEAAAEPLVRSLSIPRPEPAAMIRLREVVRVFCQTGVLVRRTEARAESANTLFIGYSVVQQLRPLAESECEHAAILRLSEARGDESDMRVAAAIYERVGEGANAQELLRMLQPIKALF